MPDIKEIYKFIKEFWLFIKEFYVIRPEDEYWDRMISSGDALYEKHKFPLAKDLIVAFMKNREREEHDTKAGIG